MKFYFTGSVHGSKGDYQKIFETLKQTGCIPITSHLLTVEEGKLKIESHEDAVAHYRKVLSWIQTTDFVVCEVTYPSVNVGHELTVALEKSRPTVALYREGNEPVLLRAVPNNYPLIIVSYNDENMVEVIGEAVKKVKETSDIRFNFFITPQMISYMDWLSEKKRIPRSVYLRGLIDKEMRLNKEYMKEIDGDAENR